MKSSITVGPIQATKAKVAKNQSYEKIRKQMNSMKVGNFFEVSGLSSTKEVKALRGAIQYFSKKDGVKVTTSMSGSKMAIEKVKSSSKTKSVSTVQ
jgi:hypothetical protein